MSREFLSDVLEKFAQVTSIIVETSKIKEDLDNSVDDTNLQDILERIKGQVEYLFEHATSVKDFLNRNEGNNENNFVNGKAKTEPETSDPINSDSDKSNSKTENEGGSENSQTNKPRIKLVDIKKLVEPRTLIKQNTKRPAKHVHIAETVDLISSSDEEIPKSKTTRQATKNTQNSQPSMRSRRKAAEKTIEKNRKSLQFDTSSSFSDEEIITIKPSRTKNGSRRKFKEVEQVKLTVASSSSDSSDSGTRSSHHKKQRDGQNNDESEVVLDLSWKEDPKFNSKCYVKVVRVPCEKLKQYYLEKLELLEINKLTDLTSLKRKRRRSACGSSSDNSKKNNKPKRKHASEEKQNEDSEESPDATKEVVEPNTGRIASPVIPNDIISNDLANTEMMVEQALQLLESDIEENNADSSDKESDKETEKEETGADVNAEKDKGEEENIDKNETQGEKGKDTDVLDKEANKNENDEIQEDLLPCSEKDGEKQDKDSVEEKQDEDSVVEKTVTENTAQASDNNEDASKDETEKENHSTEKAIDKEDDTKEEDGENIKEKKKDKAMWRSDKLLTTKLSSSDSEEELAKFKKKKEKMEEQGSSDDEPKLPKTKKQRKGKKRMKKAILSDSDSDYKKNSTDEASKSSSSSESEKENEQESEPLKKSRKRVKRVCDSSDEDDDEKSTRKQIRNIWGRDSLAETTKKAEAEEKERKARIADKQKKYNQMYESGSLKNSTVEKVVLDYDEENKKELLKVDDVLVSKLKPHQASGVQFMWDACFESLKRAKSTIGSGCILAHCMGLGKTLQVIALTHTLLTHYNETKVKKVLVVSPLNTVLNWVSEFKQWLPDNDHYDVYELVSYKQNFERQYQVKLWHNNGGVLIIGYDMFRNLSNPDSKRLSKKMRATFQEAFVDPGADLVICDEGHLLKNEKTNLSIAMNRIKTLRRIVLTGTPLQNNLKEYFCMVQFIKPNLLGTYKEYLNRFVNPIINGQYTDSTLHDIQVMRKRSHVLHKMLDGVVQRRDYSVLEPYLPPKHEYVLFLQLSEVQIKLYQHYMDHFARRCSDSSNRTSFLFVDFQALQRICAHPRVLLDKSIEMKLAKEKNFDESEESEGSLKNFIDDGDAEETTSSSNSNSSSGEDGEKKSSKNAPRKRMTRAAAAAAKENGEDSDVVEIEEQTQQKEWWQQYCDGKELDVIRNSSKLFFLFEILKECEAIGDKVLVFSQSLYSLNVIEYFLAKIHDATQAGDTDAIGGYSGSWCLGLDYFRLDGSSSCDSRSIWCKIFNDSANTRARLFLISTRAGGLGINLVAANRVIIFDVSWNPSHDVQSIYRVFRFGQTKPCYIYRFVTHGTMEMKIYERQVTKQAISKRVIDEQQIDRHYNQNDLAELYKFDPDPGDRPIPLVPKDVLLGELIQKFEDRIYKYHEHQSLLENKEEEGLNEEERKAAWEEFENEKKHRNTWGSNYVMGANMELAIMTVVRKENPALSDIQIQAMVPAIRTEMQEQVSKGDLTLYRRVQQELQIIQAIQNQRLKDQFYQQQMIKAMQQQRQMAEAMKFQGLNMNNVNWPNPFSNQPGTSRAPPRNTLNANEIIDLND